MSVNNGQVANANTFNTAFVSKTQDTETVGRLDLENVLAESGPSITNTQRELNKLNSFVGSTPNTAEDTTPTWSNNDVGASTDDLKQRADLLTQKMNASAGHEHDGSPGGGKPIEAASLANVPLEGWFSQGADLNVTGGTHDVSTELTGKTPSTGATIIGVVVNAPYNKVILQEASGPDAGTSITAGGGEVVYARVTESVGVWTLTFYYDLAGVETAYSFGAATDVRWFYQELYNPMVNSPVYDPAAYIPSDSATADVVDAGSSQRGLVSTTTQSFAGNKTFDNDVTVSGSFTPNGVGSSALAKTDGSGVLVGETLTKGDLISANAGGDITKLTVGADGEVLIADSAEATGLKWGVPAGGTAIDTSFTPAGDIVATNVQTAIQELDSEKANLYLSNLATPVAVNEDFNPQGQAITKIGNEAGLIWKSAAVGEYTTKTYVAPFTGDTTSGNATISNIASTTDLNVYQTVTGAGIPRGARIVSVSVNSIVLDKNATATAGAVSLTAQYALIADSQPQTSTTNSGGAHVKSGSVVDGLSGQAEFGSGKATGSGSSGDAILKAGEVVSGTRGRALLEGRYAGVPQAASDPSDFLAGGIYFNMTTQKLKQSNGTVWKDLAGSGGGGINYFTNPDAETDTADWVTFKDADQPLPVDGVGGTALGVTFTRSTVAPLRGTASFLFTKLGGTNYRGEGASIPFTIDSADKAKVLAISADYEVDSGVYATGDVAVYVYDVSNNLVIQPSSFLIENVGIESRIYCTFQTSANSTSYRFILFNATTSTAAFALKLDNFSVGPQVTSIGVPDIDWTPYTPTVTSIGGTLTNFTASGFWKQRGDSADYMIRLAFTGAAGTWSNPLFSLPPGQVADDSKTPGGVGNFAIESLGTATDTGVQSYKLAGRMYTTTQLIAQSLFVSGSNVNLNSLSQASPFAFASGDEIEFIVRGVPIVGWTSSTVKSSSITYSDDIGSVHAFAVPASSPPQGYLPADGTNVSRSVYADLFRKIGTTFGVGDGSTTFTLPDLRGIFIRGAGSQTFSSNTYTGTFGTKSVDQFESHTHIQNAHSHLYIASTVGGGFGASGLSGTTPYNGTPTQATTATNQNTGGTETNPANIALTYFIKFVRGSTAQISASEVIAFRATNTAGTSLTGGGGYFDIPFVTINHDRFGSFVSPTFTAPAPGIFTFSFNLNTQPVAYSTTQGIQAKLVVTGKSAGSYDGFVELGTGVSRNFVLRGTIDLDMNAGDTLKLQAASDLTVSLNTTTGRNYLQASRLGGVG